MQLRVVSYNVAGFARRCVESGTVKPTVAEICKVLQEVNPHVVCLQEVDLARWPQVDLRQELAQALGVTKNNVVHYGHAKKGDYGNLIASKFPIQLRLQEQLNGGSVLEFPPKSGKFHRIVRGLVVADIFPPESSQVGDAPRVISVANTHLDHIQEKERERQLEHVTELLQSVPHPLVLCGDLNALTRSDYTHEEWSAVEERHSSNGWAPPEAGCLQVLSDQNFVDTFLHFHAGARPARRHTSHANVRIDYCFGCDKFLAHFKVNDARVMGNAMHSDHFPLVIDFEMEKRRGDSML